jgi:hypothetical protein
MILTEGNEVNEAVVEERFSQFETSLPLFPFVNLLL